jgi:hypothetical protein
MGYTTYWPLEIDVSGDYIYARDQNHLGKYQASDGTRLWYEDVVIWEGSTGYFPLEVEVSGDYLYTRTQYHLAKYRISDGTRLWYKDARVTEGSTTYWPLGIEVSGDYIYAWTQDHLAKYQASDGTLVWHKDAMITEGSTTYWPLEIKVSGDDIYVRTDHLLAEYLASDGALVWYKDARVTEGSTTYKPLEIEVSGDYIYARTQDHLAKYKTSDGTLLWHKEELITEPSTMGYTTYFPLEIEVSGDYIYARTQKHFVKYYASNGTRLWYEDVVIWEGSTGYFPLSIEVIPESSQDNDVPVITINPGDSIQTAINIVRDGGTVILNPGIYYENGITISKNITLQANTSAGGNQANTIIDGIGGESGIFRTTGSSFTLESLTLRNGRSDIWPNVWGGAIYSEGDGSSITVTDSTFVNCSAIYGGAIYSEGDGGSNTVTGSTFTDCSAQYGGAIYSLFSNKTTTVTDSTFNDCSAYWGGAIYLQAGPVLTVTNSTFTNCTASDGSGGAISMQEDTVLTVTDSTFTNCSASDNGGAIYTYGGTVTVTASTFTNCSAGHSGGTIYTTGSVKVTSSTFTNCLARGGGAIYLEGDTGSITVDSSTISDCSASLSGGAIYTNQGTVEVLDSTITNCSAKGGIGGAIFGDTVTMNSSTISHSTAVQGGAISGDAVTVEFSTISNCLSSDTNWGWLIGGSTITITSSIISNSTVSAKNGGILYADSGNLTFCRIINNTGTTIYSTGGTIDATNNWWGTNDDPSVLVSGDVSYSPWLVLGITATPASIDTTQTSTVQTNLTYDSDGVYHNPALSHVSDAIPVIYSVTPGPGSVSPGSAEIVSGLSQTTFTPTTAGTATVNATVDGQTVSAVIDITGGEQPPVTRGFNVTALCPVDISITDPDGLTINKLTNEITGATYTELGPGADGTPDARIEIPERKPGDYLITVTPKPGADPAATFSLQLSDDISQQTIANNVPINQIPTGPYRVRVTSEGNLVIMSSGNMPVPEFPSTTVPVIGIIGFMGAVLYVRRTRDH